MTYFLWPAITKFDLDKPARYWGSRGDKVEETVDEYMKLFLNMQDEARSRSIKLTFVLIPEASMVDEQFYQFWLPLFEFREYQKAHHEVFTALAEILPDFAPVINLLDFPNRFSDAYWHFDGHFNETGNAAAAEIVTDYLNCTEKSSPDCSYLLNHVMREHLDNTTNSAKESAGGSPSSFLTTTQGAAVQQPLFLQTMVPLHKLLAAAPPWSLLKVDVFRWVAS